MEHEVSLLKPAIGGSACSKLQIFNILRIRNQFNACRLADVGRVLTRDGRKPQHSRLPGEALSAWETSSLVPFLDLQAKYATPHAKNQARTGHWPAVIAKFRTYLGTIGKGMQTVNTPNPPTPQPSTPSVRAKGEQMERTKAGNGGDTGTVSGGGDGTAAETLVLVDTMLVSSYSQCSPPRHSALVRARERNRGG